MLYARVSGDDRDRGSLESQIELCRAYALERGYAIVAELCEDVRGTRGADLDLEKLNQVLDMAKEGQFDVLVVREMDRLARDTWKQGYIENELKRFGCTIEFVLYDFPPTPEGDLQRHFLAGFAEYEAKKITQRLQRGRRGAVQKGNVIVSGRPPYGYCVAQRDGKTVLEVFEPEARIVRMMYTWYTQGDADQGPMTSSAIARRLTELGIPTWSASETRSGYRAPRQRHRTWVRSTVQGMLGNEVYAGVWRYGKTRRVKEVRGGQVRRRLVRNPPERHVVVQVPAIVTREMWNAAQDMLKYNQRAVRPKKYPYLVSGRVVCGHSGHRMVGSGTVAQGRVYTYYYCPAFADPNNYAPACDLPRFHASDVDGAVWAWLRGWLIDPKQLWDGLKDLQENGDADDPLSRSEQIALLNVEIAKNEDAQALLLDLYLVQEFDKADLMRRKRRLDAERQDLVARRDSLQAEIRAREAKGEQIRNLHEFAERVRSSLDAADRLFARKRQIVEALDLWVMLRVVDGKREVRVTRVLGIDVFALCP